MADAKRDENFVPTMLGTLNTDGATLVRIKINASSHAIKVSDGTSGSDNGPTNAPRDNNFVPAMMGVSSADGVTPVVIYANSSGYLLTQSA